MENNIQYPHSRGASTKNPLLFVMGLLVFCDSFHNFDPAPHHLFDEPKLIIYCGFGLWLPIWEYRTASCNTVLPLSSCGITISFPSISICLVKSRLNSETTNPSFNIIHFRNRMSNILWFVYIFCIRKTYLLLITILRCGGKMTNIVYIQSSGIDTHERLYSPFILAQTAKAMVIDQYLFLGNGDNSCKKRER